MRTQRDPPSPARLALRAVVLLFGLGLASEAYAQTGTGGDLSGTIRDPTGAFVPRAEVVVREETTGFSRTVAADGDGYYSAPSLQAGVYSVSTAPPGFKTTVVRGVELHVGERRVVDLRVEVGAVDETVTVLGEPPLVDVRTGEVSSLVSATQAAELPLAGRNYAAFALLVPGVSPSATGGFATRGTGLGAGVDMSVNGNRSNTNMWTVDGVNNMDMGSGRSLLVHPSVDAIQELQVERNAFGAEYGQAQGAVVNVVTRGGTNAFHGTAFEFLRNDALNANDFFLNRAGQQKAPLRYNNFGFNVSGPAIEDRVFFFWSEEWRRERRGYALSGRVPTAAEKVGDFSGALTGPLPHVPGAGPCVDWGDPGCFPGDRVPRALLSPAGLALLRIYPDPNVPDPTAPGNNWFSAPLQPTNTRQDLARGDAAITDKTSLMVRWIRESWTHERASGNFWGDSPFPTLSSDFDLPSHSFAVKLTTALSSTTVNEFQFSRAGNDILIVTSPETEALNREIGSTFPTVFPRNNPGAPSFFWASGGYTDLWHLAPWNNHEDHLIWKDDFSKVFGGHTVKAGALFSHNFKDEPAVGPNEVAYIQGGGTHTGNVIADLLVRDLPLANYVERDNSGFSLCRWQDLELYGTDTWKVSPTITLTLGLRYSRFPQPYSANDRISNYLPRLYDGRDPASGLVQAGEAERAGLPRSLVETYNLGLQPRLGLAWDVFGNGRTALRLGLGRFLGRASVIQDVLRMATNPPWTTIVDSGWGGSGETATLADCPTCRSLDTINPGLLDAPAATPFYAVSERFRPPESWQWNLTLSREVMEGTVVEVSYVGNRASHIWRHDVPANDVVPSARLAVAEAIRNGDDPSGPIAAGRVLPGVGPVYMSESTGDSEYHGLQVWVNRRFAEGLAFQVAYTWGHAITNAPLQSFTIATSDPFDFDLDRGDSDLDRRHMLVANAVYVLPSFEHWGRAARQVLGGWQVNAIASLLGGTPVDVLSGANTAGLAEVGTQQRPDLVPGVPVRLRTGDPTQFLNPAAFALPAAGRFGTLGRGAVRGPGIENVDLSLVKNWRAGDRFGFQFRAEAFNVFNHPNFRAPDGWLAFQNDANEATFGQPLNAAFGTLNAAHPPREIQFGVKLTF